MKRAAEPYKGFNKSIKKQVKLMFELRETKERIKLLKKQQAILRELILLYKNSSIKS